MPQSVTTTQACTIATTASGTAIRIGTITTRSRSSDFEEPGPPSKRGIGFLISELWRQGTHFKKEHFLDIAQGLGFALDCAETFPTDSSTGRLFVLTSRNTHLPKRSAGRHIEKESFLCNEMRCYPRDLLSGRLRNRVDFLHCSEASRREALAYRLPLIYRTLTLQSLHPVLNNNRSSFTGARIQRLGTENAMRVTEAKMKGIETFCATVGCSSEERTLALVGARLFFEKGWPTTCFTVPMAISAAKGLLPHKYTKARSRARYEYAMAH